MCVCEVVRIPLFIHFDAAYFIINCFIYKAQIINYFLYEQYTYTSSDSQLKRESRKKHNFCKLNSELKECGGLSLHVDLNLSFNRYNNIGNFA